MRTKHLALIIGMLIFSVTTYAQDKKGHINENKFRQLYQEFSTPNMYRSASGVPGPNYYQQQADYKIAVKLDDANQRITGEETITYKNNSPDDLAYLWVQLDQNIRKKNPVNKLIEGDSFEPFVDPDKFTSNFLKESFDGGFDILSVTDKDNAKLRHTINQTMMRIDLKEPLKSGSSISFNIKWKYNVNNHVTHRTRSGYEYFKEDDNRLYIIAQFYPRMCVYNDVEGWQNNQFWGRGEFALPFGNYEVSITAPSDHILDGTGVMQNRKEMFTSTQYARWQQAKNSYDKPVIIVTQDEAIANEKTKATDYKTWKFKATNVRDFAFSSSRRFIYDAMAVSIGGKKVMAISMYPKEGNPLWEEYSTKAVASTLKSYSKYTFDYPYHKAISVHSKNQGMEYPMICWNYGRPDKEGKYTDRVKYGMLSVIIHEVGHNFFPMIVNSDERQWTWMDEGLNTFMQYLAEQDFAKKYLSDIKEYPSRRGPAPKMIPYMKGNQSEIAPIMTNSENIHQFGNNAYGKPATALNILREVVMGHELFDYAFQTYAQQWKFKHPTPEDFFRTMEQASAIDLDWFWRGWFYTTDFVDIGVSQVKKFYLTNEKNNAIKKAAKKYNVPIDEIRPMVYLVREGDGDFNESLREGELLGHSTLLSDYIKENYSGDKAKDLKKPKYLYEVTFNKPGGIPMPIIATYEYEDGTTQSVTYPSMVWRKNDKEAKKAIVSDKKIVKITVDADEKTADIDTTNNVWPKTVETQQTDFDKFKTKKEDGKKKKKKRKKKKLKK